jgi:hypothetical protein
MSQLPDGIDLPRHRDFEGRETSVWLRRAGILILLAFVIAGLLNVFGQASTTSQATGAAGTLTVTSPEAVRGGLIYQARFTITAEQAIEEPVLRLDRGWYAQTTINTLEPEPAATESDERYVRLRFDPLDAGRSMVVYLNLQANPTNVGSHDADVALLDGDQPIASVSRHQIDWP